MSNQIEREAWVKQDKLKNPVHYVRGTDLLPIVFHFRDFSIPSGATARVFVAKPDGNAVYDSATIEGNDVTVDVTDQMFLVLGMTLMQISIFDGEEELVSFAQPVMVEQNLKAGDFPESTTDVSFLDNAIEQANQAVNTATTAASQAAQAVQNANQAIADANEAISDLNEQIASLNTNFATLANNVGISQLDTTAKTLVKAINELNSKNYLLFGGIPIPNESDLNSDAYKIPGSYYCHNSNNAKTLINCPFESAFLLKVSYGTGLSFPVQSFTEFRTRKIAERYYDTDLAKWSEFVYFSDDATLKSNMQSPNFITDVESSTTLLELAQRRQNTWYSYPATVAPSDLPSYLINLNINYGIIVHTITKVLVYITVYGVDQNNGVPRVITGCLVSAGNRIVWEDKT